MPTFFSIVLETLKESAGVFVDYWWFFMPLLLWPIFQLTWVAYVQEKYIRKIRWNLLEVKVPSESEKRPKTMEEFFSGLASVYDVIIDTLYDIYLAGMVDSWFSFEIVSFEGDIHFYIRTPDFHRDLVESQLYGVYPDAEIKEVEDYVVNVPNDVPGEDYNIWGTDMMLVKDSGYPIRTYKEFEDEASGEFVDPLANVVEGVSKLSPGEQIWIQILVRPCDDKWKKTARDIVLTLAGRSSGKKSSGGFFNTLINEVVDLGRHIVFDFFNSGWDMGGGEDKAEKEHLSMMLHLSPGEKDIITGIDGKIKKPGFETDIRYIYAAKSEVFDKGKANSVMFSYFTQFGTEYLNRFAPDGKTKTSAYYFFPDARKAIKKRAIMRKYKRRELDKKSYVLTSDELATLFHFPTNEVKAPVVPRVAAKKGKPPATLPI